MYNGKLVSVIIPTMNEEKTVCSVLGKLPGIVDEAIIVDGLSHDRTVENAMLAFPNVKVLLETRPGKGAALKTGFRTAKGDYVIQLDGDGSMPPSEITKIVAGLDRGYDVVKGSRFLPGGHSDDITPLRACGNRLFCTLVNCLFHARFTDLCYGLIGYRQDALNRLNVRSDGFNVEVEINILSKLLRLRMLEVASVEKRRLHGLSKLNAVTTSFLILLTIVRLLGIGITGMR